MYLNTITIENTVRDIFSDYFDTSNPDLPKEYNIYDSYFIEQIGVTELVLKYKVRPNEYKTLITSMKKRSAYQIQRNQLTSLKERYVNNRLFRFYSDSNALLPDIERSSIYNSTYNTEHQQIFIFDNSSQNIIKDEYRYNGYDSSNTNIETGYSIGAVIDSTNMNAIYWLLAW